MTSKKGADGCCVAFFFCRHCKKKHCPQNPIIYSNNRQKQAKRFHPVSREHALSVRMPLVENRGMDPKISLHFLAALKFHRHHFEIAIAPLKHHQKPCRIVHSIPLSPLYLQQPSFSLQIVVFLLFHVPFSHLLQNFATNLFPPPWTRQSAEIPSFFIDNPFGTATRIVSWRSNHHWLLIYSLVAAKVSAATFPAQKKPHDCIGFFAGFAHDSLAWSVQRPSARYKPADALNNGVLWHPVRSFLCHLVEASNGWLLFLVAVCSFRS